MSERAIRFFDFVFSGLALLVLSPLLLVLMVLLRLTGEGEVFFRQQRVGYNGKLFGLIKFATMLRDSPNIGTGVLTVKGDPRILPLGSFLRRSKLNELPQLFNVLKGDMSLIGPRPQAPLHFAAFPAHVRAVLVQIKPGLSGAGSILFRDEENVLERAHDKDRFYREIIAPYKGEVEIWYVRHRTLKTYFTLIGLTIWTVLVPGSRLYHLILKGMPRPPASLEDL